MEIIESNLQGLAGYISQTLSPDPNVRKPAEKYLESVEAMPNYPLLLLHLVDLDTVDMPIRVASAIAFKNFVKRNWPIVEDSPNKICEADRHTIKERIVSLMLNSPEHIQRQLSDAISAIGREDFPAKWPTLIHDLVDRFKTENFHMINGVLRTAHSLFKRYRHEFQSNGLWLEIKLVLDIFAGPLTELLVAFMNLAKQHENNKDAIGVIYSSLLLVSKIFYSLNAQEIPEFFEDNMKIWMPNFHTLLVTNNALLNTADDEEAGLLEQLRSQICDNVSMYAQKYDEEFEEYLPQFVQTIWTLLVTTGNQTKFDGVVSNAISFLALVAEKERNKHLFANAENMSVICQKVIIPNMEFRATDEELFEDNAEEYIRRDIEGSDVDTRRRAACDFVRALSRHFEPQMTAIFGQFIQEMLVKYSQNPQKEWKSKDAAIYLVTSLVAKGQTQKEGVTKTNELVNVLDFYRTHILTELQDPQVNSLPVLKADAIKYVMIFRNVLPQNIVKESIPFLVRHISAESAVVYTYASTAIEKILLIKQTDGSPLVKSADLSPVGQDLLSHLFLVLNRPASKENEYVMKTIMRSLSCLQEATVPLMPVMLPKLLEILVAVSRNPSKPFFNHYMFESLCLCVRIMCKVSPDAVGQFEQFLFPVFQNILQQDVAEFIPYVFQVLALLLEFHKGKGISDPYMALFPHLLTPALWDKTCNVPPLARLMKTYITIGPQQIVVLDKVNAILGVFQKLIASKSNDHEGFALVTTLIENLPQETMSQYLRPIFMLLFQRLTSSKTTKFVKCLLAYFCSFVNKYGAPAFIEMIDTIEPKFMGKVVDRIFIADLQKISGPIDKRRCSVGVTKILCEAPQYMLNGDYAVYWVPLLQALIQLFELPEDQTVVQDEHFAAIEEISGYQSTYAQLNFAGKKAEDPLAESVPDVKLFLAQSLGKLSTSNPGKLQPLCSTLNPVALNFLNSYLTKANVQVV